MVKDISPLAKLKKLKRVKIKYNEINDASALSGFKRIADFRVRGNPLWSCSPKNRAELMDGKRCTPEEIEHSKKEAIQSAERIKKENEEYMKNRSWGQKMRSWFLN